MFALASWKVWVFGVLSWLIPFVASFGLYDASGALVVAQPLFKSLMVVFGGAAGAGLLVLAFRHTRASIASGLAIGALWLAINLILDIVVLVPMSGMSFAEYMPDIGLRYLLLPIFAVAMGAVAQQRA